VWLASNAYTVGCCERVVVCRTQRLPSALTRNSNTLRKQTILVRVSLSACNFFLNMFYTNKHSIKLCGNTSIIQLIDYMFQKLSLLHWQG
jgi:hypothetical protein